MTQKSLRELIASDRVANPRDPKSQIVLFWFRVCNYLLTREFVGLRFLGLAASVPYRFFTEFLLGLELRPKTNVGESLTIYHGFGLVINDHAIIGNRVTLRNGVTIGHARIGGSSPVIEDDVVVGAGAIIIGEITVGKGATIGAGAVVVKDVPADATVVGNPATTLSKS